MATRNRIMKPGLPRLFAPEEFRARPTMQSRLRELAKRPGRAPTLREARLEEDEATMKQLRRWGDTLCAKFNLRYRMIEAEDDGVTEWYGVCYDDGEIRIRLRHATTGRLLKQSSLVDTLCHELAHLRYMDHGLKFRRLHRRILDYARELEIYKPGPAEPLPRQMSLFDRGCATRTSHHNPRTGVRT